MTEIQLNLKDASRLLASHFDELMNAVAEDLLITDGNGMVLWVSPSFEDVYGLHPDQALGRTVYDLEIEGFFNPSIIAVVLKQNQKITMEQSTHTGRTIVVTATPICDDAGNIRFVISFSRDITEVIDLQERYASLKDQVEKYTSEISRLREQRNNAQIICNSQSMEQVMNMVRQVADYDVNVLLLGESGVGKTSLAKSIHQQSSRRSKPFIDINCAAIPDNLLEAELFGYEKGAFTGADTKGKPGQFELADQGTLFLDEISEIPLPLQAKILKAIQEKVIVRVGGIKPVKVDFRLIAASNQDLEQSVAQGHFRKDLYYRLNVMQIRVPSIAERKDDIVPLINHFLTECNRKYGRDKTFEAAAINKLLEYSWPGNVREISNVVERTYITSNGNLITLTDLPEEISDTGQDLMNDLNLNGTLNDMIERLEKRVVVAAFEKYGSTTGVARHLGISQPTASRKIAKYIR